MCLQYGLSHVQSGAEAWEQQSLGNNPPVARRLRRADWHTRITLRLLSTVTFCGGPTCIFNVRSLKHALPYPCAALQWLRFLLGFPCWGAHVQKRWWWREFYDRFSSVCTVAALWELVYLSRVHLCNILHAGLWLGSIHATGAWPRWCKAKHELIHPALQGHLLACTQCYINMSHSFGQHQKSCFIQKLCHGESLGH